MAIEENQERLIQVTKPPVAADAPFYSIGSKPNKPTDCGGSKAD
jgi:hypothetical protein